MSEQSEKGPGPQDSKLTIPWVIVILAVVSFNGWMLMNLQAQGDRVTKIETRLDIHLPMMSQTLAEMQLILKDVRDDQIRRQKQE